LNRSAVAAVSTMSSSLVDFGLDKIVGAGAGAWPFSAPLGITMPNSNADRSAKTRSTHAEESAVSVAGPAIGAQLTTTAPEQAVLSSAEQDRVSVQAALQGDQAAFGDLVTRYQTAVYNMAYRMLGNPTEAEDAAQEVFVRAWNQLHSFQMERRFSTWLLSIASHHCIDLLRRRRPSAPLDDVALYVPSNDPEPIDTILQVEQADMVKSLLNTLPDKYRSVTVLRYYNDLSYDEIANMTGLTESAVKTQLHRARRMLAEKLRDK